MSSLKLTSKHVNQSQNKWRKTKRRTVVMNACVSLTHKYVAFFRCYKLNTNQILASVLITLMADIICPSTARQWNGDRSGPKGGAADRKMRQWGETWLLFVVEETSWKILIQKNKKRQESQPMVAKINPTKTQNMFKFTFKSFLLQI